MVFYDKNEEVDRNKQLDFVSKLTFIRGLKDIPDISEPKKGERENKNWIMPEQPDGYIKCKRHDFL